MSTMKRTKNVFSMDRTFAQVMSDGQTIYYMVIGRGGGSPIQKVSSNSSFLLLIHSNINRLTTMKKDQSVWILTNIV